MDKLSDYYKAKAWAPGLAAGTIIALQRLYKKKKMEKKAALPLLAVPLITGAIGAIGSALTAPKGQRLSSAITGGAISAATGGIGGAAMAGGKALLAGTAARTAAKSHLRNIAAKGVTKAVGTGVRDVGIGAMMTGAMGGYKKPPMPSAPAMYNPNNAFAPPRR